MTKTSTKAYLTVDDDLIFDRNSFNNETAPFSVRYNHGIRVLECNLWKDDELIQDVIEFCVWTGHALLIDRDKNGKIQESPLQDGEVKTKSVYLGSIYLKKWS